MQSYFPYSVFNEMILPVYGKHNFYQPTSPCSFKLFIYLLILDYFLNSSLEEKFSYLHAIFLFIFGRKYFSSQVRWWNIWWGRILLFTPWAVSSSNVMGKSQNNLCDFQGSESLELKHLPPTRDGNLSV